MTNDLISRSALLEKFTGESIMLRQIRQFIHIAPAVDAVEVVRCKDCEMNGNCLTEDTFRIARIENSFCCAGKRRGDDGD